MGKNKRQNQPPEPSYIKYYNKYLSLFMLLDIIIMCVVAVFFFLFPTSKGKWQENNFFTRKKNEFP